jgi:hypothetical protein
VLPFLPQFPRAKPGILGQGSGHRCLVSDRFCGLTPHGAAPALPALLPRRAAAPDLVGARPPSRSRSARPPSAYPGAVRRYGRAPAGEHEGRRGADTPAPVLQQLARAPILTATGQEPRQRLLPVKAGDWGVVRHAERVGDRAQLPGLLRMNRRARGRGSRRSSPRAAAFASDIRDLDSSAFLPSALRWNELQCEAVASITTREALTSWLGARAEVATVLALHTRVRRPDCGSAVDVCGVKSLVRRERPGRQGGGVRPQFTSRHRK